jgi:hypothetical protein
MTPEYVTYDATLSMTQREDTQSWPATGMLFRLQNLLHSHHVPLNRDVLFLSKSIKRIALSDRRE